MLGFWEGDYLDMDVPLLNLRWGNRAKKLNDSVDEIELVGQLKPLNIRFQGIPGGPTTPKFHFDYARLFLRLAPPNSGMGESGAILFSKSSIAASVLLSRLAALV